MFKFYVKVFKTSLFAFHLIDKREFRRAIILATDLVNIKPSGEKFKPNEQSVFSLLRHLVIDRGRSLPQSFADFWLTGSSKYSPYYHPLRKVV